MVRVRLLMDIVTVPAVPDGGEGYAILAGQFDMMLEDAAWISARIFGIAVACLCSLISMNLLPNEVL